jgi:hypothetical protein
MSEINFTSFVLMILILLFVIFLLTINLSFINERPYALEFKL